VRTDSAAAREGVMEAEAAAGKARVVVVGAGVAGSLLAKTMQGHAHVVLLDP
jgi:choline dehydrogenase-like flavoprotein